MPAAREAAVVVEHLRLLQVTVALHALVLAVLLAHQLALEAAAVVALHTESLVVAE